MKIEEKNYLFLKLSNYHNCRHSTMPPKLIQSFENKQWKDKYFKTSNIPTRRFIICCRIFRNVLIHWCHILCCCLITYCWKTCTCCCAIANTRVIIQINIFIIIKCLIIISCFVRLFINRFWYVNNWAKKKEKWTLIFIN